MEGKGEKHERKGECSHGPREDAPFEGERESNLGRGRRMKVERHNTWGTRIGTTLNRVDTTSLTTAQTRSLYVSHTLYIARLIDEAVYGESRLSVIPTLVDREEAG